jgi:ElaB/YqjD/DUF883 family membrane-anchored ribosome-binding protein
MSLYRIPTLDEYIVESLFIEIQSDYENFMQIDHKKRLIEALISTKSNVLDELQKSVLTVIYENNGTEDLFNGTLNESTVYDWCMTLNEAGESIAQKWKDKAKSAIATAKEKGKEALSNTQQAIMKIGADISGLVKVITASISEFIKKAWKYIYEQAQSKLEGKKEKIIEAAKAKIHSHGVEKTSEEVKNLKAMCKHAIGYFTGNLPSEMGKGAEAAATANESIEIYEKSVYLAIAELIEEGEEIIFESDSHGHGHSGVQLPFISSIAKKLTKFPPFTWMHHAESFVAKQANNVLEKTSEVLTKFINAPGPFEFVVIGALVGIAAGYQMEHGVAELLKAVGESAIGASIVVLVPGIGWILHVLGTISMGMFLVACTESAITLVAAATKDKNK